MTYWELRDQIIEGLAACLPETDKDAAIGCEGCPYGCSKADAVTLPVTLVEDVRALLKAQEPVEPIIDTYWETPSVYDNDVKVTEHKCGAYGAEIDKWDKYCRVCGGVVKWDAAD